MHYGDRTYTVVCTVGWYEIFFVENINGIISAVAIFRGEHMTPSDTIVFTFDPLSRLYCHFTNCIFKDSQKAPFNINFSSNLANLYTDFI